MTSQAPAEQEVSQGGVREEASTSTETGVMAAPVIAKGSNVVRPSAIGETVPEAVNGEDLAATLPSSSTAGLQSGPQSNGQPVEEAAGSVHVTDGQGSFQAVEPTVEAEASFGYFTPRSLNSQFANVGAGRGQSSSGWPGWMARIGELFNQPTAPAWLPSPIPSPPRPPAQLLRRSPQEMRVQPTLHTPTSSSVPAEAIQAEVQRQLGTLLDRLSQAEQENQRLQEALAKARTAESRIPQRTPEYQSGLEASIGNGGLGIPDIREDRDGVQRGLGVLRDEQRSLTSIPKVSGDPWAALWEGISGRLGSRSKAGAARADQPSPEIPKAPLPSRSIAEQTVTHDMLPGSSEVEHPRGMIEALTQSVKQLQEMQVKALQKDDISSTAAEAVIKDCYCISSSTTSTRRRVEWFGTTGLVGSGYNSHARFIYEFWVLVGGGKWFPVRIPCG